MTGQTRADSRQKRVYIVSFPRSGNTWVRLLLEHSLGFETESVYPEDRQSQAIGMLGDAHLTEPNKVELVKTHATSLAGNDDVIYVLRDGRDATASYWYYLQEWKKQHIGDFTEFLQALASSGRWWPFHVHSWLETLHPHRLLLVRYEDLKNSQEHELGRILAFLGRDPIRPFSDYAAKISFENLHASVPTFFRSGRISAWREIFSQDDERFFLAHDLGYLSKLGYIQPNEDTLASLTRSELRSDVLVRSLLHRSIVFERALEEKEKVIQEVHAEAERRREALEEIDRTLQRDRAEWAKERQALSRKPLSF